jgi:hypothetical protein
VLYRVAPAQIDTKDTRLVGVEDRPKLDGVFGPAQGLAIDIENQIARVHARLCQRVLGRKLAHPDAAALRDKLDALPQL